jgi:hypothetical protein
MAERVMEIAVLECEPLMTVREARFLVSRSLLTPNSVSPEYRKRRYEPDPDALSYHQLETRFRSVSILAPASLTALRICYAMLDGP